MRLAQKVSIVTGAGAGIGLACAQAFAREGAAVALVDINSQAGEPAAQSLIDQGAQAAFIKADMSDPSAVDAAVQAAVQRWGRVDILLSNAGVGGRSLGDGPAHRCTIEAWDAVMTINLRGTFLACKSVIPYMLAQGGGSIVTMASVLGLVGTQGLFDTHAYATSKAGIIGLTRAIAAHYAASRIRANAIAPGLIDTRMAARTKSDPALLERVAAWQPLGPLGSVEDVAAAAVFFAGDESRFITGTVLPVDGGWTAQ